MALVALGLSVRTEGTGVLMWCKATLTGVSPSKGTRPVIISKSTTPKEYRSELWVARSPLACSGEK